MTRLPRPPHCRRRHSCGIREAGTLDHARTLFERDSGLTTDSVGSANLTATALGDGHEWMGKVCATDLPHVIEKFTGTFETPELPRESPVVSRQSGG